MFFSFEDFEKIIILLALATDIRALSILICTALAIKSRMKIMLLKHITQLKFKFMNYDRLMHAACLRLTVTDAH